MHFEVLTEVPQHLLEQWSAATQNETHLAPETVESLRANLKAAVIAFEAGEAIGFAGLIEARTAEGYGMLWQGKPVIELGGAFISPPKRGSGIWRKLMELRLNHARNLDWCVVCITGSPTVQNGLRELGSQPIRDRELQRQLCLECSGGCTFCPLVEGTAWRVL